MLKKETAAKLAAYVDQGGTLISEGLPGYFGDHGHVGATQPNLGLDQLFGARERYVEFTPDLLEKLQLTVDGHQIFGRYFLQEYNTTTNTAKVAGEYANGHIAAVENGHGKGRTLLIGTYPGAGYYLHHSAEAKAFFAGLLKRAGVQPVLQTNNPAFQARLHSGPGGDILWITNPTRKPGSIEVSLNAVHPAVQNASDLWAGRAVMASGSRISVSLPPRDGAVIRLNGK
jgi:beta-galactosidase